MKFIALFRGINVGGNRKVEMKKLKLLFEKLGYTSVSTYINSGNVIFETSDSAAKVEKEIKVCLKKEFSFEIQVLIKSKLEIQRIAESVPTKWLNNTEQKTDVAYLYPEIDIRETIDKLPINREYIDIRYTKGAIFWNVRRENYNKSHLNKIVGDKLYQQMTVRNINTARFLAK